MSLAPCLEQSRDVLVARWVDLANAVYPFATAGFLRTSKDPFANPVGTRADQLAGLLFTALTGQNRNDAALFAAMEEFVRVRAIQDMPAEESLAVMFSYTTIFRSFLADQNRTLSIEEHEELVRMDMRQSKLALAAFGMYAKARETLFAARLEDIRRRHSQIVRLAQRHGFKDDPDAKVSGPAQES